MARLFPHRQGHNSILRQPYHHLFQHVIATFTPLKAKINVLVTIIGHCIFGGKNIVIIIV